MSSSTKSLRWLILALAAAAVLLLRAWRGDLLRGMNPLLIGILLLAGYMLYREARRK